MADTILFSGRSQRPFSTRYRLVIDSLSCLAGALPDPPYMADADGEGVDPLLLADSEDGASHVLVDTEGGKERVRRVSAEAGAQI